MKGVLGLAEISHVIDDASKLEVLVAECGDLLVVNSDASVARGCGDSVGDSGPALTIGLSCKLIGCQDHRGPALNQQQASVVHNGHRGLNNLQTKQLVEWTVMAVCYVEVENSC